MTLRAPRVRTRRARTALLVLALSAFPVATSSAWSPTGGAPVCVSTGSQEGPLIVGRLDGGMVVAWTDHRGSDADIYMQRLDPDGNPVLASGGVPLCTAAGDQVLSDMIPVAGGFMATWTDMRTGDQDIYALRCGWDGAPVTGWTSGGVPVTTAAQSQFNPRLFERSGGDYVIWGDQRNAVGYTYGSRIASGATVYPGNANSGVPIVPNGADVALDAVHADALYHLFFNGPNSLAVMRAVGVTVDPTWPAGGAPMGNATPTYVLHARMAADPQEGVAVAWIDIIGGNKVLHLQRILENGTVPPGWPAGGVTLSDPSCLLTDIDLACDASGNIYVAWACENPPLTFDSGSIHMTKITPNGSSAWGSDVVVRQDRTVSEVHLFLPCGSPSVVSWEEYNGTDMDLRVQRVSSTGALQWGPDGLVVTSAPGNQLGSSIANVGPCGDVGIAWQDYRSGDGDIYAARILNGGIASAPGPSPAGVVPGALSVRIAGANPSRGPTRLALSMGEPGRIRAEVVDVAGRHLRMLSDGWRDAGPFTMDWDGRADDGSTLAAGVYLVRVTAAGKAAYTRVVVLP